MSDSDTSDLPRILLVCRSGSTAKSFSRLLQDQFQIEHVNGAQQGWEQLQQGQPFTLLVCELAQAMDEVSLLERTRKAQSELLVHLPVLLLVGEADEDAIRDQAFEAGATDFIHMPFSSLELKARVQLHARMFGLFQNQAALQITEDNTQTDLLNTLMQEKYFQGRLEQELSFSLRHNAYLSLCMLKVDGADEIEDQYGKKILRALLRAVSGVISRKIRREDSYAFLGDSTFAVLFPVTNGLGAQVATKRLIEKIESTQLRRGEELLTVTLSAGLVSRMPDENDELQHLMDIVEQRLDKATRQGGAQIVSSKSEQEQQTLSLEQALNMIRFGHQDKLPKQIPQLVDNLMPLLTFIKQHNSLEFDRILDELDDGD